MSKTITAKFNSIDVATIAASNVRDRCENVKGVKIKYKQLKKDSGPFAFSNVFAPVDASVPNVLQNGIFPTAVNVDAIGGSSYYRPKDKKANVEIIASDGNVSNICATLRQGGGIGIRVR